MNKHQSSGAHAALASGRSAMTPLNAKTVLKVATFLLDERRLSAGEQSFLANVSARASRAGAEFYMSERQEDFWNSILDSHDQALVDAGLVEAWAPPTLDAGAQQ